MSKSQRDKGAGFEREIAKLLGVRRHLRCDYSESAPDIKTEHFIVECKRRKAISAGRWMDQVAGYAEQDEEGRIPVVFCREDGGRVMAILYAEDLLALVNREQESGDADG